MFLHLSFQLLNTDYKHDSAAYEVENISYAGMHSSCFLSVSISSQHTISSFCFGQEEGHNFKNKSMQKGCSSVFPLEPLRGYRAGKDNLFIIIIYFCLHHHQAGVQVTLTFIPSDISIIVSYLFQRNAILSEMPCMTVTERGKTIDRVRTTLSACERWS